MGTRPRCPVGELGLRAGAVEKSELLGRQAGERRDLRVDLPDRARAAELLSASSVSQARPSKRGSVAAAIGPS